MVAIPKQERSRTVDAIYEAYAKGADKNFRPHLGASIIGKSCMRALWYDFRWVTPANFSGRMLRLFETGKLEEARFVDDLRSIGCRMQPVDPDTGEQFRVTAWGGHFGGSLDGKAIRVPEAPKTWHVVEFKTHSAKSFAALTAKGVEMAKPQHFAQMQIYMHLAGLTRALYLAVNKDTDELYSERVRYDPITGEGLLKKAHDVIFAPYPPARQGNITSFGCKFCDHAAVCHGNQQMPAINCRTCVHATPLADGTWDCGCCMSGSACLRHGWHEPGDVPWLAEYDEYLVRVSLDRQRKGCPEHRWLPDLITDRQTNAASDLEWVEYTRADGTAWRDDSEKWVRLWL